MNTVLKRLHDEAVIYTVGLCGQEHANGPRPFQEVLDEKFAELIVRECCDVFVELRARPADLAVKDVKNHFGVEE
jgi:hypothetical protein